MDAIGKLSVKVEVHGERLLFSSGYLPAYDDTSDEYASKVNTRYETF